MVEFPSAPLDVVFAALADPTRRTLIGRLALGEASIGELAAPFPMTFAGVSKHLQVLEAAGLLRRRRVGRSFRLRLAPGPLRAAAHWSEGIADTAETGSIAALVSRERARRGPVRYPRAA